jgi:anti-sigma factor RsiW
VRPTDSADSCATNETLIEAWLDGDLDAATTERLRRHFTDCASCAAELRVARELQAALRALPEIEAPAAILERVRRQVGEAPTTPARLERPFKRTATRLPRPGRHRWAVAAALAAALSAALGTTWILHTPAAPTPTPTPSAAEVRLAARQARFALSYVSRATRRAGLALRDDVLEPRVLLPATLGAERPLDPRSGSSLDHPSRRGA